MSLGYIFFILNIAGPNSVSIGPIIPCFFSLKISFATFVSNSSNFKSPNETSEVVNFFSFIISSKPIFLLFSLFMIFFASSLSFRTIRSIDLFSGIVNSIMFLL